MTSCATRAPRRRRAGRAREVVRRALGRRQEPRLAPPVREHRRTLSCHTLSIFATSAASSMTTQAYARPLPASGRRGDHASTTPPPRSSSLCSLSDFLSVTGRSVTSARATRREQAVRRADPRHGLARERRVNYAVDAEARLAEPAPAVEHVEPRALVYDALLRRVWRGSVRLMFM